MTRKPSDRRVFFLSSVLSAGLLLVSVLALSGCKKDEPAPAPAVTTPHHPPDRKPPREVPDKVENTDGTSATENATNDTANKPNSGGG